MTHMGVHDTIPSVLLYSGKLSSHPFLGEGKAGMRVGVTLRIVKREGKWH